MPEDSSVSQEEEDQDELEDLDTEGILASDDSDDESGFDPMDIIAAANAEESNEAESKESSEGEIDANSDSDEPAKE
jgi:hypothetical protein